jgi:hypothetical protein
MDTWDARRESAFNEAPMPLCHRKRENSERHRQRPPRTQPDPKYSLLPGSGSAGQPLSKTRPCQAKPGSHPPSPSGEGSESGQWNTSQTQHTIPIGTHTHRYELLGTTGQAVEYCTAAAKDRARQTPGRKDSGGEAGLPVGLKLDIFWAVCLPLLLMGAEIK